MNVSLVILALFGCIDGESYAHRHHHHQRQLAHEPIEEVKHTGSYLKNMTDLEMKEMAAKTKWSTLNYGLYEQKKFSWDSVKPSGIRA